MEDFVGLGEGLGLEDSWRRSGDFQRQRGVVSASRREEPRSVPELERKWRREFIGGLRRERKRRKKLHRGHRGRSTEGTERMLATLTWRARFGVNSIRIDRREISHIRRATLRRSEAGEKASPLSVRNDRV